MAVIVPGMTPVSIMTGMVRGRRCAVITMGGAIMGAVVNVLICGPAHGPTRLLFARARKTEERAMSASCERFHDCRPLVGLSRRFFYDGR